MTFPGPPADQSDAVLHALVTDDCQDMRPYVQAFAPLLFALAEQCQLADPEGAVGLALEDIRVYRQAWIRSGLAARVWVVGIARRRFQLLHPYGSATD